MPIPKPITNSEVCVNSKLRSIPFSFRSPLLNLKQYIKYDFAKTPTLFKRKRGQALQRKPAGLRQSEILCINPLGSFMEAKWRRGFSSRPASLE
jgi:hypothetical protein